MNISKNKKAFTLVELIVVITILSVLATVAFISFQWYAASSRDSVRLSDIKSMEKVINLYRLTNSKYPTPNAETSITYSGSTAWIQWVFGTNSYTKNTNLSDVPVDPITELPYAYSVTNRKNEYQIAAVLEWEVSNSSIQTYAWTQVASVYVKWDYNGKILRVRKDTTDYILWVPSIIASDINDVRLENILQNQKLVFKWHNNLPASYSWSIYDTSPANWFAFEPSQVILFEWNIDELESNLSQRTAFLDNLQTNYSWTIIAWEWNIAEILAVDSNSNKWSNLIATTLNNTLKTKIDLVKITENINSSTNEIVNDCNNLIWIPLPATQLVSIDNYNIVKNFIIPQANAFEFVPIDWGFPVLIDPEPTIYHYTLLPVDLCDNTELGFTTVAWETGTGNVQNVYKINLAEYEEYEIDVTWDIREQILIFDKDANLLISVYDGIPKYTPTYTWVHYIVIASFSGDPINHWTYNIKVTHNINVAAPVPEEEALF